MDKCRDRFLKAGFQGKLLQNAPLVKYTTFRIGGPADYLLEAENEFDLLLAQNLCKEEGLPLTLIGRGSNLLIRDGGIRGLVVVLAGGMEEVSIEGTSLHAQAGASLPAVSRAAQKAGLADLTFACGIPGSIGGAVVMNAGAYGGEIASWIEKVRILSKDGRFFTLSKDELAFSYRHSLLQEKGWEDAIVTHVDLRLQKGDPACLLKRMEELTRLRREKQPLAYPSAGSAFKRPANGYAAQMIEQSGCKGLRIGQAQVSTLHAGFIVNLGGATAKDTIALFEEVQKRVFAAFHVQLEWEVRLLGQEASQ